MFNTNYKPDMSAFAEESTQVFSRMTEDPMKYLFWPLVWIFITVILAFIAIKLSGKIIDKLFVFSRAESNKSLTLRKLTKSACLYLICILAFLTILVQFGFNPTTILAGASIFGLAIGVGAQSLIKDIITGFFLIFERQLEVGDFVQINDKIEGTVEEVGIRVTKVREASQRLHYLPNGTIVHVTNYNRDNMRAIVNIILPLDIDVDTAIAALNKAAEKTHDKFSDIIKEMPEVMGITNIDQNGMQLTVAAVTSPKEYWKVARELRKEAITAFQKEGLEIFSHQNASSN